MIQNIVFLDTLIFLKCQYFSNYMFNTTQSKAQHTYFFEIWKKNTKFFRKNKNTRITKNCRRKE